MAQSHRNNRGLIIILILIILILIVLFYRCCKSTKIDGANIIEKKDGKVSWNILFKPGTDKASRDKTIQNIRDYVLATLSAYNQDHNTKLKADSIAVDFCPCDTLLYNIGFGTVNAAGESVTTVPRRPAVVPEGNNLLYQVAENEPTKEQLSSRNFKESKTDSAFYLSFDGIDSARTLAIIDAGIDSSLFNSTLWKIWDDGSGGTIRNFLPGQAAKDYYDGTQNKHGSAVAAITLKAMNSKGPSSKLMVLKAINDSSVGSIFSVSCALSYARQKKATLINLSLGYYGGADSVLHYYLSQCDSAGIEIFAAAGNKEGAHNEKIICSSAAIDNLLAFPRLFYPACFSADFKYFTTVTQVFDRLSACYYQNYSDKYVTLGIYDSNYCCSFYVGFIKPGLTFYEGSSFVTPAASGLRMGTILRGPTDLAGKTSWTNMMTPAGTPGTATVGGRFIEYSGR
ncbi:MAG: S8 family serine peptidase [Ferruginibacter sp.]